MIEQKILDLLTPDKYKAYLEEYADGDTTLDYGVVGSGVCDGADSSEPLCGFVYDGLEEIPERVSIDEDNNLTVEGLFYLTIVPLPSWAIAFCNKIIEYTKPEDGVVTVQDCLDALDSMVVD